MEVLYQLSYPGVVGITLAAGHTRPECTRRERDQGISTQVGVHCTNY